MGLEYLNNQEIKERRQIIKQALAGKPTHFVTSGTVMEIVKKYSEPGSSVLEIGAGSGYLARQLYENGYKKLIAVDIDDYLDEDVKRLVDLDVVDISYEKLSYADGQFDLILTISVIEHLENPFLFIRESRRVLKTGGKLIFVIPNIFSLRSRLKFLFHGELQSYTENNNHISIFSKAVFNKVFYDFERLETVYSPGYFKFFGKKIRFGKISKLNKFFGDKVLYVLKKK